MSEWIENQGKTRTEALNSTGLTCPAETWWEQGMAELSKEGGELRASCAEIRLRKVSEECPARTAAEEGPSGRLSFDDRE